MNSVFSDIDLSSKELYASSGPPGSIPTNRLFQLVSALTSNSVFPFCTLSQEKESSIRALITAHTQTAWYHRAGDLVARTQTISSRSSSHKLPMQPPCTSPPLVPYPQPLVSPFPQSPRPPRPCPRLGPGLYIVAPSHHPSSSHLPLLAAKHPAQTS